MTEESYLNPSAIKDQCELAVRYLKTDNESLHTVEDSLDQFTEDEEIKGAAFDALKQQISDYRTILQAIRSSNDSDIADFNTLAGAVGEEVLIGKNILSQQKTALDAKSANESTACDYACKANSTPYIWMECYYNIKAGQYRSLAENSQKLYEKWKAKEEAYDSIENATCNLFTASGDTRTAAQNALMEMGGVFVDGAYKPDMGASWRTDLDQSYVDRVVSVSEEGEIAIDWQEVEKILSRDAGEITESEYRAIAQAYVLMDNNELAKFMQYIIDEPKDVYWNALTTAYGDGTYISCTEWSVNERKMDMLLQNMETEIQITLTGVKSGSIDFSKQNRVLQRNTILEVVKEIGTFRGEYQGGGPELSFVSGEDNRVTLFFYEEKREGELGIYTSYGKSSVSIYDTSTGMDLTLENHEMEYAGYKGFFCSADDTAEDWKSFAVEETVGNVMEFAAKGMPEVFSKAGSEFLGLVGIAWDVAQDEMEEKATERFLENRFETNRQVDIYQGYQCPTNIVEYDTAAGHEKVVYGYEGEYTSKLTAQMNAVFEEYGGKTFTAREVVENPSKVYAEYMKCINGDDEAEHKFNEAALIMPE